MSQGESAFPSDFPADLPAGLTPRCWLSQSPRGDVLEVSKDSVAMVLRLGGPLALGEVALAARVQSPGLVAPESWGTTDTGRAWVLRPFIEGPTWDEAVRGVDPASDAATRPTGDLAGESAGTPTAGRTSPPTADPATLEGWALAVLETLADLHGAGLVHRDVKGANVIISADGPVLMDLDLLVEGGHDAEGAGSPLHMAPEVLLGQPATPASDLFALGAMLALSTGDAPSARFHRAFPGRSFWEASGLDPNALPGVLGSLTRQLVRRHPGDRPVSARAAAQRLTSDEAPLPALEVPFLAGRHGALGQLLSELEPDLGARTCLLVTVTDPEERAPLLDGLQLSLTVKGSRACQESLHEPPDESIQRIAARHDDVVLVDGSTAQQACGLGSLVELIVAFNVAQAPGTSGSQAHGGSAGHTPGRSRRPSRGTELGNDASALPGSPGAGATLGLVLNEDSTQELLSLLRERGLDDEARNLRVAPWPRLSARSLARHLDHLTGDASPDETRRLAGSLHRLTDGRWSDVLRRLVRAPELGVLRPDPPRYTLLRATWPDDEDDDDRALDQHDLAHLSEPTRLVLAALASCHWSPDAPDLAAVAGLDGGDVATALRELIRLGALSQGSSGRQAVRLTDTRWSRVASESLATKQRKALQAAALKRAQATHLDDEIVALQRLSSKPDAAAVNGVLDAVDGLLAAARPAAARRLVQELAPHVKPATRARRDLTEARVELAQGDARQALSVLENGFPKSWKGCDDEVLLVAAQACEQSGRRDEARGLYERIHKDGSTRALRLRGRLGLAFSHYLGGDSVEALEQIGQDFEPEPDDAASTLAQLFDVRGSALTALGQLDAAGLAFDAAAAQAKLSEEPLLIARSTMNRARLHRRCGRSSEALEELRLAVATFSRAGHVKGRAQALNNLGVLHRDRGELAQAQRLLLEALSLLRRVGDVHGAAMSLGSLAAVSLEVGHLGSALETLQRAREIFAEGEHERELAFLDIQEAMALALVGRHGEAADMLAGERLDAQRAAGAPELLRAEALLQLVGDQRAEATTTASLAVQSAGQAGDSGALFRCAAVLAAADPDNETATAAMSAATDQLQAPVREAESAWRNADPTALRDPPQLDRWMETFENAGRTDLVAAVGRCLADAADAAGDRSARRATSARVSQAADALTDGLPPADRQSILDRLDRLSGPSRPGAQQTAGLNVDWLLSCNRRMATETDLEDLLLAIVDMSLERTGARRGLLVLLDGEEVAVQVARNLGQTAMAPDEARFSRTVVLETVRGGEPVLTTDAGADTRFSGAQSISSFGLHSVLCVPLPGAEGLGAIYLDDDQRRAVFDETDVERVRALADQAAVAIGHQRRRLEIESLNARLADRVAFTERELAQAKTALRRQGRSSTTGGLVGDSEAMVKVCSLIERVAPTELAVLITGPSGTGKDLVARALHECSDRASGPLIIENVAALPANLLESEMFGHARGAFTGADRDRPGLFAEADGGTFVLDEIGEMPLELQPKFLRVLESGEFRPVGSRRTVKANVRIVAATNRDLLELVREGKFREDLYYRLNAIELRLPSLDQRLDDIPLLVQHFLGLLQEQQGAAKPLSPEVLAALVARPWPGQVRELANEVRRLYFLSDKVIDDVQLVREAAPALPSSSRDSAESMPESLALEDVERAAIERALRAAGQSKQKAALMLGVSRAGLYAKIRRLGLGDAPGEDDE